MSSILHPKVYKKDSKNKIRFWQIEEDGEGRFRSIAGLIDGQAVTSEWTVCEAKNVGRANETSPAQQSASEVASLYQKKADNHYVDSIDKVDAERAYFEVMLAQEYEKNKKLVDFKKGAWVQPKLDGLRGPTSAMDFTHSRKGKEYVTCRFLTEEVLAPLFEAYPDIVLDGEIYNHDYRDDFNEITSRIKQTKPDAWDMASARELAQLHVYDCFFPDEPELLFEQRYNRISALLTEFGIDPDKIRLVPTYRVYSFEEIDKLYEQFLNDGYEGQMIRINDRYHHKRVKTLLKRKEFLSDEFPIDKIEEGKGNWSGAAKHVTARLPDGRPFGAGVKGTRDYLRKVLEDRHKYTTATIEYFKPTPDGIPRFARVKTFYEGERDD